MIKYIQTYNSKTKLTALALSSLLAALQMLRSVKDSMAVENGLDHLQWLITGSFLLIGLLSIVSFNWKWNHSKIQLIFSLCFISGLFLAYISRNNATLFVFINAFSLILISQFWKVFINENKAKKNIQNITFIAICGSVGGILGPFLSILLTPFIGIGGITLTAISLGIVVIKSALPEAFTSTVAFRKTIGLSKTRTRPVYFAIPTIRCLKATIGR